ncbi:MAG: SoxR reducing system RseC family protein [Tannerella sp.]|jgi:sigma-E factor negative regulatory protein RseC|nr:SoxR reducing system RseC family protein [Tannerella sp.]
MGDFIRHRGKIERIEKHKALVRIEQSSACSGCHASAACLSVDKKDKIVEIDSGIDGFAPDEEVIVGVRSSAGFFAVLIAFVLPLTLVVATFFASVEASGSDGIGGIAGLAVLVPYYIVLYFFRDRLKNRIIFTLEKIQDT